MFNRFALRALVLFLALLGGAALMNTFALYVPKSAPGWTRFHFVYEHASNRSAFLDDFQGRIREHGGGYTLPDINNFLLDRLEKSADQSEQAAFVRFYCLQAGGREGDTWRRFPDATRRRVVAIVLANWRSYPPQKAQKAFVWLEELRLNEQLDKANLLVPTGVPNGFANTLEKVAPVANLFERWNRKYAAVPVMYRPNPLAGTRYEIQGL